MKDQLTVLIFKDGFTARTFRVPLKWVHQFGWLLGALVLTVALCVGVTVKTLTSRTFHFDHLIALPSLPALGSSGGDDAKVKQLENQLKDAQAQIQALSVTASTPADVAATDTAPVIDQAKLSGSTPIVSKPFLFYALPEQTLPPADPATVPIKLTQPQAHWEGKTLKVRFAIQYVSEKPGGQQGRILILARGPGALLTHPSKVIQAIGKDHLIDPSQGEYFSVSRFREDRAEFGPVPSRDWLKEVEVVILSSTGQLLIHQKITPTEGAAQ